jgi:hypothetical protein
MLNVKKTSTKYFILKLGFLVYLMMTMMRAGKEMGGSFGSILRQYPSIGCGTLTS